jgi:hypothetical protein
MFATQAAVHSTESARIVIILSAIALIVYWRTIIRLALMVLAALILAILGLGAIALVGFVH